MPDENGKVSREEFRELYNAAGDAVVAEYSKGGAFMKHRCVSSMDSAHARSEALIAPDGPLYDYAKNSGLQYLFPVQQGIRGVLEKLKDARGAAGQGCGRIAGEEHQAACFDQVRNTLDGTVEVWEKALKVATSPPFPVDVNALMVTVTLAHQALTQNCSCAKGYFGVIGPFRLMKPEYSG